MKLHNKKILNIILQVLKFNQNLRYREKQANKLSKKILIN